MLQFLKKHDLLWNYQFDLMRGKYTQKLVQFWMSMDSLEKR